MFRRYPPAFLLEASDEYIDCLWRRPFVSSGAHRERRVRRYDDERARRMLEELFFNLDRSRLNGSFSPDRHRRRSDRKRTDARRQGRSRCLPPPAMHLSQTCQVTMVYGSDSSSSTIDEIVIKQKSNEHEPFVLVYKGFLRCNESLTFKSQHDIDYPFELKFYVNGRREVYLKECCEHRFRHGRFRLGDFFELEQIYKSTPCSKCSRHTDRDRPQSHSRARRAPSVEQPLPTDGEEPVEQIEETNKPALRSTHSRLSTRKEFRQQNSTKEEKASEPVTNGKTKKSDADEAKTTEGDEDSPPVFQPTTSDDGATAETTSGGFFQSLMALFRDGMRQREIRATIPERMKGNVEDFLVVLFNIAQSSDELHVQFNLVQSFDQLDSLKKFLKTFTHERLILITDPSSLSSLGDLSRFDSIYLHSNELTDESTATNIRGTFDDLDDIFTAIRQKHSITDESLTIESSSASTASFVYHQLLKETWMNRDNEGNAKKDFFSFCRVHYADNGHELKWIDRCEQDLQADTVAHWFVQETFLRKMVNRACRTGEIDLLYKVRWILQLLNGQIRKHPLTRTVFHLDHLSLAHLETLQENRSQQLISFGNFLTCKRDPPTSFDSESEKETVVFQIKPRHGLDVDEVDAFLLPFDQIYRVDSIETTGEHSWIIHLSSTDADDAQYAELSNDMREEMDSPVILIQLGKLLVANDDYSQADYLSRSLFADGSMKDQPTQLAALAAIHHLLGSVDHRQNHHHAARLQFEQSLRIFLTFVPEDNAMLSATYNNIGSMFYQEDQHEQAIHFHQKALQCQLKSHSPEIDAIATYTGNIGAVYLDQKKYDQALIHYKRALQILLQSTPAEESLAIAMVYDRLASIYWRMDQPDEALPFYQKSLQLELKYLPENDHKISVSYFNLSTAYARLDQLDEAITCAEKSLEQLLKSVPANHPEVKENTEQLEGLRRKKLLQQLYA